MERAVGACSGCRYWARIPPKYRETAKGECRRHPPVVLWAYPPGKPQTVFPITLEQEGCAEHEWRTEP